LLSPTVMLNVVPPAVYLRQGQGKPLKSANLFSRYNEGCRELANYLLFNFYDLRLNELEE